MCIWGHPGLPGVLHHSVFYPRIHCPQINAKYCLIMRRQPCQSLPVLLHHSQTTDFQPRIHCPQINAKYCIIMRRQPCQSLPMWLLHSQTTDFYSRIHCPQINVKYCLIMRRQPVRAYLCYTCVIASLSNYGLLTQDTLPPNQWEILSHHEAASRSRCLPAHFK
jgi:hypothetical protein